MPAFCARFAKIRRIIKLSFSFFTSHLCVCNQSTSFNCCKEYQASGPASAMRDSVDLEDRYGIGNPLPPIPVPDSTLGSPYENVRVSRGGGRLPLPGGGGGLDSSSPSTSPTHWEFYHSTKARQGGSGDPTSV